MKGGKKLQGEVNISGSKNASLPIIAATILNSDITKLYNVPKIRDTQITLEILKILGCKIKHSSGKIEINSKYINKTEIPEDLMRQMRSTVILAGAILGRFKEVKFSCPGGCEIGARPIDLHLSAFKKMGIQVEETAGYIKCSCDKIQSADINLDFPSVGATENIILAATLAEGTTIINNAAMEPEIIDLANCLNKMGAKIYGAGTNVIKIVGVNRLKSVGYKIMPDRIEAGTFLCAAAVTGGRITVNNVIPSHITPVIHKLEEAGCKIDVKKNSINLVAFAGYKHEKFTIGAEYNHMWNAAYADNANQYGYSIFGSVNVAKFADIYARFDDLYSNDDWNIAKDERAAILGAQFKLGKYVKIAPNFRMSMPKADGSKMGCSAYVNCYFGF
mgnify:CR=1 FL=1